MQNAYKIILIVCVVLVISILLIMRFVVSQFMSGEMVEYITPTPVTTTTPPVPTESASPSAKLFFVALEDNGVRGKAIGCGDSIVASPHSDTVSLNDTLEKLLSVKEKEYGQDKLYNALYQSNLQVDTISQDTGVVTVKLSGKYQIGGVCDGPRIQSQLEETVKQFEGVQEVHVLINEIPLEDLLSGR